MCEEIRFVLSTIALDGLMTCLATDHQPVIFVRDAIIGMPRKVFSWWMTTRLLHVPLPSLYKLRYV